MEINTILVTGSEGYIGSVLVPKLLAKKYNVIGLDAMFFQNSNLENKTKKYILIKNDLRNLGSIDLKSIDAIIHLAALSNDPLGELDSELTLDINFKTTVELAKKAKKSGVKKFIFSSSCSVYGTATKDIVDETNKLHPLTSYAKSKILTEKALQRLADDSFSVNLLRNSTVYGYAPHFRDDLVVNNLTLAAYTTGVIKILSDGTPWRPLIDVQDLSDIFIMFLEDPRNLSSKPINIGFNENNLQVKEIVDLIHNILPNTKVEFTNQQSTDKRSYKVDFGLFNTLFPKIKQNWTIEKSIRNMTRQFKKHNINKNHFDQGKFTRLKELQRLKHNKKLSNLLYWNP